MTRLTKAAVTFVALILSAAASAASAQTYGFTHAAELVTARGQVVEYLLIPGAMETTCDIEVYGVVALDGKSIVVDYYDGVQAPGDAGNLACSDAVEFPIIVTATSANQINLDQLIVGTRAGPCQETDYKLAFAGNTATLSGVHFGSPAICRASGNLLVTTDTTGAPVTIVANP